MGEWVGAVEEALAEELAGPLPLPLMVLPPLPLVIASNLLVPNGAVLLELMVVSSLYDFFICF